MTSDLAPVTPAALAARQAARDRAEQSRSAATIKAYRVAWAHFAGYCAGMGVSSLPADPRDVAAYIEWMTATHAPSTIEQRLAAIANMHKLSGYSWDSGAPALAETWQAIQRAFARPPKKAAAVTLVMMRALVATCDDSAAGVRDRAMLLLNFAGGFRRSELVALAVGDVAFGDGGVRLTIRRGKGDQLARGAIVAIPSGTQRETCPVAALRHWMALLGRTAGPLFRRLSKAGRLIGDDHMQSDVVWDILERRAALAGIEAPPRPHGMRAGCITTMVRAGARDHDVMRHVRIKDVKTMAGYIRGEEAIGASPATLLGL